MDPSRLRCAWQGYRGEFRGGGLRIKPIIRVAAVQGGGMDRPSQIYRKACDIYQEAGRRGKVVGRVRVRGPHHEIRAVAVTLLTKQGT